MSQIACAQIVFLLIAVTSCIVARPLKDDKPFNDSVLRFEVLDLFTDGSSPKMIINGKKHMKNTSGKSDEGGYYKTYGSDADGEKGYVKQTYSNGDQGYKTFDTFHKKDGDNYGFEEHTGFGKSQGGEKSDKHGKTASYKTKGDDDHEGAGTIVDSYYAEDDGENAGYTDAEDGEGDASGESASYTDGGDSENYTGSEGGDAEHYTEGGSDNDGNSENYNEHYSSDGGDEGSYGTHGSYTSDGDGGDGFDGGEYY